MKNLTCAKITCAISVLATCLSSTQFHFAVQADDGKLKSVNAEEAIKTAVNTVDSQLLTCALDECARTGEVVHLLPILRQLNTHIESLRSIWQGLRVFGIFSEVFWIGPALVWFAFAKRVRYLGFAGTLIFIDGIRRLAKCGAEEQGVAQQRLSSFLQVLRERKGALLVDDAETLQVKLERRRLKRLCGVEL